MPRTNTLYNLNNQEKEFLIEECYNYLTNDYDFYKLRELIEKSLNRKIKYNIYDPIKSQKAWFNGVKQFQPHFIKLVNTSPYFRIQLAERNNIKFLETNMLNKVAEKLNQDFMDNIEN